MPLIVSRISRRNRKNSITRSIFVLAAGMLFTTVLFMTMLLASCAVPITYHDTTTYKNLTDLKAETMMLFETFDTKPFAENKAALLSLALKYRKAYEYEKGKGNANSKTMQQFEELQKLLNADVADYQENKAAKLGPKYFHQAAVVLGQAFDIAIATENLKNKDR
jgi:alpha-galactosidase/6-phospho-beta-glucosidase family protein